MGIKKGSDYTFYLYTCNKCGSCFISEKDGVSTFCPGYNYFKFFTYTGGGKLYLAQGVLEGKVKVDNEFGKVIYQCMDCGACEVHCPAGIEIVPVINALREEAYEKGVAPPAIMKIIKNIKEKEVPDPSSIYRRKKILSSLSSNDPSDIFIYFGCSTFSGERSSRSALHFLKVLKRAGVKYSFGTEEPCCGAILHYLGDRKGKEEKRKKLIKFLNSLKEERIVVFSPECYTNILFMEGIEKEIIFYTDYLLEIIGTLKRRIGKNEKITFHDPCSIARGVEEPENLKNLLETCGFKPVLPERWGRETFCCGGSFGVEEVDRKFAQFTTKTRIKDFLKISAKTVVTSCPRCLETLTRGARGKLNIIDVSELFRS